VVQTSGHIFFSDEVEMCDSGSIKRDDIGAALWNIREDDGDGFLRIDRFGRILDVNSIYCGMSGYSRDELLGLNVADIEIADTAREAGPLLESVKATCSNRFKSRHRAKNGNVYGVAVSVRSGCADCDEMVAFVQDTTVRSGSETIGPDGDIDSLELADIIDTDILQSMMEDFHRLTGMLGAVLDISGRVLVAVGWQDICTQFHRCHPETLRNCIESDVHLSSGVPDGEFKVYRCKNNMWDMVTPLVVDGRHLGNVFIGQFFYADEELDVESFRKQARRYGFDETEYLAALDRVPRFSREAVNSGIQFYAKLAGLISSLSFYSIQQSKALAAYKHAEKENRRSKERYQIIFEQAPLGIALVDSLSGKMIAVNSKYMEIAGRSREEMESINWMAITHPDDIPRDWENMESMLTGETDGFQMNKRYIKPDGSIVWVGMYVVPTLVDNPLRPLHLAMVEDITERIRIEDEIMCLNEELEQRVQVRTAELEAINRELESFSYSVSHDLRAPLRAVDGFSQILVDKHAASLDDEGVRYLDIIRKNTQDMGKLIDDLLAFSRIGKQGMNFSRMDVAAHSTKIFSELVKEHPDRKIEFIVGALPHAMGDIDLLRVALVNLFSNAIKYTGNRQKAVIEFTGSTENGFNTYCLKDNGVGFDMKYVDKLFGVFERLHAKDEFEGTGVGLALVQRIIDRHGGRVWAEGVVGQGALFFFELPVLGG
jgi:PAS domain S-box-containing protein